MFTNFKWNYMGSCQKATFKLLYGFSSLFVEKQFIQFYF